MWAFPPPSRAAEFAREWHDWEADIVAVVPVEVGEGLGSAWATLQVYEMDSAVC